MDLITIRKNLENYFEFASTIVDLKSKFDYGHITKFMGKTIVYRESVIDYDACKEECNQKLLKFYDERYRGLCSCLGINPDSTEAIFYSIVPKVEKRHTSIIGQFFKFAGTEIRYSKLINHLWENVMDLKKWFVDYFDKQITSILENKGNISVLNPIWGFYYASLLCPRCKKRLLSAMKINGRWKHSCDISCGYITNYKPVPKEPKY